MGTETTERPSGTGSRYERRPNKKRLVEARTATAKRRSAKQLDADAIEALQEVLDGLVQDLRFTQSQVDRLPASEFWRDTVMIGKIPNEWIRYRDEVREKVERTAGMMIARGIAERSVAVREAQLVLMAQQVRTAAERAGLEPEQVRALGRELRAIAEEAQAE